MSDCNTCNNGMQLNSTLGIPEKSSNGNVVAVLTAGVNLQTAIVAVGDGALATQISADAGKKLLANYGYIYNLKKLRLKTLNISGINDLSVLSMAIQRVGNTGLTQGKPVPLLNYNTMDAYQQTKYTITGMEVDIYNGDVILISATSTAGGTLNIYAEFDTVS